MNSITSFFKESIGLYFKPFEKLIYKESPTGARYRKWEEDDVKKFQPFEKGSFFSPGTDEICIGNPKDPTIVESGFKVDKLFKYILGATLIGAFLSVPYKLCGYGGNKIKWIKGGMALGSIIGVCLSYQREEKVILVFKASALPRPSMGLY